MSLETYRADCAFPHPPACVALSSAFDRAKVGRDASTQKPLLKPGRNTLPTADPLLRFRGRLSLPLISAPMFLVSGVELVVAACRNCVIRSFPPVNCRSSQQLDDWLGEIEARLRSHCDESGKPAAPIRPNLIVHRSNARLAQDLQVLLRHRPEMVITSVGSRAPGAAPRHEAGALVF